MIEANLNDVIIVDDPAFESQMSHNLTDPSHQSKRIDSRQAKQCNHEEKFDRPALAGRMKRSRRHRRASRAMLD